MACSLTRRDILIGILIAAAMAAVIVSEPFQVIRDYKVGDIADSNIRTTREIVIPDPEATEARKVQAMNATPALFSLDPSIIERTTKDLQETFDSGRRRIELYEKQNRATLPLFLDPQRHQRVWAFVIPELSMHPFPDTILGFFLQKRFPSSLEVKLISAFFEAARKGIVERKDMLLAHQQNGIFIHNESTGEETWLGSPLSLPDTPQAREELHRRLEEISELSSREQEEIYLFLERRIQPTLVFNPLETEKRRRENARKVEPALLRIKEGRVIARQGDEITPSMLVAIQYTAAFARQQEIVLHFLGYWLLLAMYLYGSWRYFNRQRKRLRFIHKYFILFSLLLLLSLLVGRLLFGLCGILSERIDFSAFRNPENLYFAIPFSFGSVLLSLLIHTYIALFFVLAYALLMGNLVGSVPLAIYIVLGSLAAIYGINQYRERAVIIRLGMTIGVVNAAAAAALFLLAPQPDPLAVISLRILGGLAGGIFACMFASILLPPLESLFNITTDIRLLELSNLEHPLLRRLALEAPGTYHHSIATGTLGEAAAEAIGANSLLVRVGAYYHDIGKAFKPEYFVENQAYTSNKHENLSPHLSSLVIASHVKEGLEMASQYGIPQAILDMIPQHHGTRIMTYFYQKAKNDPRNQGQEINDADYRYPGPKPQTKEAAILMIVDAVEAASRTLEDPTIAQIQGMIQRIIRAVVDDEQLDECNLSMKELKLIEYGLLKVLCGMFHHRIEYPGYNFQNAPEGNKSGS